MTGSKDPSRNGFINSVIKDARKLSTGQKIDCMQGLVLEGTEVEKNALQII
jgi:hypothetical protein